MTTKANTTPTTESDEPTDAGEAVPTPPGVPQSEDAARLELQEVQAWLNDLQQRNQQAQQAMARGAFLEGLLTPTGWTED